MRRVYDCNYCGEEINLAATKMVTRHFTPSDWLDPLVNENEFHFHPKSCHHLFTKIEDKVQELARTKLKELLKNVISI